MTTDEAGPRAGAPRLWRLRTRLAAALLLAFVPIFLLVVVTHFESLNERRDARVEAMLSIDETVAASLQGFATDLEVFAETTAITLRLASDAGTQFSQQNVGQYFVVLAESYGVRSMFLTDLEGKVVAGTTGNVGFDVSSREYFQALNGGAPKVWSGALAGQVSGQTTLVYGRTLQSSQGTTIGYLIVAFYPPRLNERLPPDLPPDANITLIDNKGIVLLSSRDSELTTPTFDISDSEIFAASTSGKPVVVRGGVTPVDEGKSYGVFVPVEKTGWIVGLTRPASAIDGPLQSRLRRDLVIVIGIFTVCMAMMILITSRLTRPLRMLAASAGAIARGEKVFLQPVAIDPDVRMLQNAMDDMSHAVAEREAALRQETRGAERLANQLARLHESRNALARMGPPQELCAVVVRQAVLALEAEAGAVLLKGEAGRLQLIAYTGYPEAVLPLLNEFEVDESTPIGSVFMSSEPLFFGSAEEQIRAYPGDSGRKHAAETQASAFLPLLAESQKLGVLVIGFGHKRQFTGDDVALLFAFAHQAAQALHRSQLFEAEQAMRSELELANAELSRSNEAKDEFLGIIAHELRTPLTTIFGGTRLLNDSSKQLAAAARDELTRNIESEANRMLHLVENLLLLSRLELGKEPMKAPVQVERLVGITLNDLARTFPSRKVVVDTSRGPEIIQSDETSLRQVLYNLLSNAAKYSPDATPIDLIVGKDGRNLTFSVRDRGPGVPTEELKLIFESFYRSPGTSRIATGKGLGLSVCRRLVESLGGRIWARTREGGGLEVAFSVPSGVERAVNEPDFVLPG